jgi:hypothetical protein
MTAVRKCPAAFVETDIDDERVLISLDSGEFFPCRERALLSGRRLMARATTLQSLPRWPQIMVWSLRKSPAIAKIS